MSVRSFATAGDGVGRLRGIRARFASLAAVAVIATAGACSSDSNSSGTPTPTTVPPATSSASVPASPGISCGAIRGAVDDLKAKVEAWKAGTASRDEVEAAARNVVATVSSQASAAGGALKSALTAVGRALGNLVETITKPGVTDSEIQAAADGVTAAASALAVSCPS